MVRVINSALASRRVLVGPCRVTCQAGYQNDRVQKSQCLQTDSNQITNSPDTTIMSQPSIFVNRMLYKDLY